MEKKSFMWRAVRNQVKPEDLRSELTTYVESWNHGTPIGSPAAFLGMTDAEWDKYTAADRVDQPRVIIDIVAEARARAPQFGNVKQYTRHSGYGVDVGLDYLPVHYARYVMHYGLDVNPDFQRGYVWTREQQVNFIVHMLRGGMTGLNLYFNSPLWNRGNPQHGENNSRMVLVDGKQRLDAALRFVNNEFKVFGAYYEDFIDRPRITTSNFRWNVNDLQTREEELQWYLDLNTGGTLHTEMDLVKVQELLKNRVPYVQPSVEELHETAGLSREVFQEALRKEAAEEERLKNYVPRTVEKQRTRRTKRK